MKYKIMTKDKQHTMKDDLTEKEAVSYWNSIRRSVASWDRIIVGDDGKEYVVIYGAWLEEFHP